MRKYLFIFLLCGFSVMAKAQTQQSYLGLAEKDLVNKLAEDKDLEFVSKTKTKDGTPYLQFRPISRKEQLRAYYLDNEGKCNYIRNFFGNSVLSVIIKALNRDFVSVLTYTWMTEDKTIFVDLDLGDDKKFFSVNYELLVPDDTKKKN